jgi:hypothetical protein
MARYIIFQVTFKETNNSSFLESELRPSIIRVVPMVQTYQMHQLLLEEKK